MFKTKILLTGVAGGDLILVPVDSRFFRRKGDKESLPGEVASLYQNITDGK